MMCDHLGAIHRLGWQRPLRKHSAQHTVIHVRRSHHLVHEADPLPQAQEVAQHGHVVGQYSCSFRPDRHPAPEAWRYLRIADGRNCRY